MLGFFTALFGSANERAIKRLQPTIDAINAREEAIEKYTDQQIAEQTPILRQRLGQGETLDALLPEAFTLVRETARRTLNQRPFDAQITGGIVLHQGHIAEMKTGEGKTLAATMPAYLNALTGKGVHIVTVNDYLAKRDAAWMGQIYKFLGLSVGCIVPGLSDEERQIAYHADITYGTNSEFGFDYLRDNMKFEPERLCQRPFAYAIVDEVDSILIDEARTPLIISGPAESSSDLYTKINTLIPRLEEDDYERDEKTRTVALSESGMEHVEKLLRQSDLLKQGTLYDVDNVALVHHVTQALRAHTLFEKDRDYIIKDNRVALIDEFTGRMMEGRRFSEGLHQALEARERVPIQLENQTLASITYQNYFRLYTKLAGMTGTALTEAAEFGDIYNLDVTEIPTNKPCVRLDSNDDIYRTLEEKYAAIISLIKECQQSQQPVLVGTVSIEKSEKLSLLLKKEKIQHKVLNARYHEQEAIIVAQAGRPGSVTIATNMAGRGTDIQLGGNTDIIVPDKKRTESNKNKGIEKLRDTAIQAGGLFIIGSERHESRRIDNQLRGRSGRQGDPGASKFFLSLEDDLMRIFGSDRLDSMLQKFGLDQGEAITHPWISKAIEKAQKKVEARNFDIRKNLLRFDDVTNDQRQTIYQQRRKIMETEDITSTIDDMRHSTVEDIVARFVPEKSLPDQWNIKGLHAEILRLFSLDLPFTQWQSEDNVGASVFTQRLNKMTATTLKEKRQAYGSKIMQEVEKSLLLRTLDQCWKEHLLQLDHLRQGINLRAYAQRDPLNEYKQESFLLFSDMLTHLRENIISLLVRLRMRDQDGRDVLESRVEQKTTAYKPSPPSALMPQPMAEPISGTSVATSTKTRAQRRAEKARQRKRR